VKKISLFGMDFTYPNAHDAEKGRACVEFWLGIAAARGIELAHAEDHEPHGRLQRAGRSLLRLRLRGPRIRREDGRIAVENDGARALPTAEEIEAATTTPCTRIRS
jgi:hypothetical protein